MDSLVVMGVSGCGKSSLGAAVASLLHWPLIEGDDFHPDANQAKMRAGVALSDADRADWLELLGQQLARYPKGAVLTCSALKRSYRDQLRAASPGLRFAWLDLDQAASHARVAQRGAAHLFPASLVANQFSTLEPPIGEAGVLHLDALLPPATLCDQVMTWMAASDTPREPE
jgi:gluconokinase